MTKALKWHGGKHYLADKITDLFPQHKHYVEPYFGAGSVLFFKNPEGISEVVNDTNRSLSNFWAVLADTEAFPQFVRAAEATPFSEKVWQYAKDHHEPECGEDEIDIDAALSFFVVVRQSRQGLMDCFATMSKSRTRRGMNEQVSSWLSAIDGLPETHERLKRVVICNKDALEIIKQQDSPDTLFYCDPPYLHETRAAKDSYGEHEMSDEQHEDLLAALSGIHGKFALSGYMSEMYDNFARYNGWFRHDFEIDNKASSSKTKAKKVECLWTNYPTR